MKNRNSGLIRTACCLLVLTVVLSMMPGMVFAEEQEHPFTPGHRHVDVEINKVDGGVKKADATLPAKLDPRSLTWYKNITTNLVRDQGDANLCWAFSGCAAARISYAWKNQGEKPGALSPAHLAYFFFNRVNDPLGHTAKDKNTSSDPWDQSGSACVLTMQDMATWAGLQNEKNTNNYNTLKFYNYKDADAYKADLVEANSVYYSQCTAAQLKQIINDYGAATVSMYIDPVNSVTKYFSTDGKSYYCKSLPLDKEGNELTFNHEVTVVGWDDNYDNSKFAKDGGSKPKKKGAWLILNSWGPECHDGGYFWISYESRGVLEDGICAYEMQPAGTYKYNYQYDGNANCEGYNMMKGEKAANTFQASSQMKLESVSFTEFNEGTTSYTVDIYTGVGSSVNPAFGILAHRQTVKTDSPGYKSFKLTKPVVVDKGEKFTILLTFNNPKTLLGVESDDPGFVARNSDAQSFYWDGKWVKCSATDDECVRIKGQANDFTCAHTPASAGVAGGYYLYKCSKCGHMTRKAYPNPRPGTTAITGIARGKKSLTVRWKQQPQTFAGNHITGYQIKYSRKKNMKKAAIVTVPGYRTTSRTLAGLKKKKNYFVQIRTYYSFNGKTYFSPWSGVKKKKTK